MADKSVEEATKTSILETAKKWGESSVPPTLLATLIAAQHLRPPQVLPLLFPPVLLFSTYLNLNTFTVDAAGISAAWSGLYLLLARRRRYALSSRWGVRGAVRGVTLGVCVANLVGGGVVYALGRREREVEQQNEVRKEKEVLQRGAGAADTSTKPEEGER